jgi:hypothetical protein
MYMPTAATAIPIIVDTAAFMVLSLDVSRDCSLPPYGARLATALKM